MKGIGLLDSAVKSFVQLPQKLHGRITYSRSELLSYRFCSTARDWPPEFDRRFARYKTRKASYFYSPHFRNTNGDCPEVRKNYAQEEIKFSPNQSYTKTIHKKNDFYDDAIVFAKTHYEHRNMALNENPQVSRSHVNMRFRNIDYYSRQPEWYVHGPANVDEEMDQCGYASPAGDEEKENLNKTKIQAGFPTYKMFPYKGKENSTKIIDKHVKNISEPLNEVPDSPSPKIKTLREIESKLGVQQTSSTPNDMTAYYKLLGLIGNSKEISTNVPIGCHDPRRELHNTHSNISESSCKYADPAISSMVGGGNLTQLSSEITAENSNIRRSTLPTDVPDNAEIAAIPCNPITASYQRHMIASAPLGRNALRWFKAMTNAASANACINQKLDGTSRDLSDRLPGDNQETSKQYGQKTESFDETNTERLHQGLLAQVGNMGDFNYYSSQVLNWSAPFHMRSSEHLSNTAVRMGLGSGFPIRPIKPLTYYYPTHPGYAFGNSVMNPFFLQQLLQYQISLRTLQIPFNYLRMQPAFPALGYSPYNSTINRNYEAMVAEANYVQNNQDTPSTLRVQQASEGNE